MRRQEPAGKQSEQNPLRNRREHWATAKAMVERMGYHQRDREVGEIARELGE
ncbi:MAG: hypothetical protein AB7U82_23450 [Blastocatellales bacterium]